MAEDIDPIAGIRSTDTVIAILGPRRAGKSYFLDIVAGQQGVRTTRPSSHLARATRIYHPKNEDTVVLVELPGFGGSGSESGPGGIAWSDLQALEAIGTWLRRTYEHGIRVTGIIYVQRITDNPLAGPAAIQAHKNCRLLYELIGDSAPKKTQNIVLVTTMWGLTGINTETENEKELHSNLWKRLIDLGATTARLTRAGDGWMIVEKALKRKKKGAMLLQHELVDEGMTLKDTRAGKTLFTSLNNLIAKRAQVLEETVRRIQMSSDPKLRQELNTRCEEIKWELGEARKDVARMAVWDGKTTEFTFEIIDQPHRQPQTQSRHLSIPPRGPNRPSSSHSSMSGVSLGSHQSTYSTAPLLKSQSLVASQTGAKYHDSRVSLEFQPRSDMLSTTFWEEVNFPHTHSTPNLPLQGVGQSPPVAKPLPPVSREVAAPEHQPPINQPIPPLGYNPRASPGDNPQSIQRHAVSENDNLAPNPGARSAPDVSLSDGRSKSRDPSQVRRDDVRQSTDPSVSDKLQGMIRNLVLDIAGTPAKRTLVARLENDDAQCMVDYLDQLLSDGGTLDVRQRKHLLNLLSRIAKSAQVYPASCELPDVNCDLTHPQAEGGYSYIYRGMYRGKDVCIKAVRIWEQHDTRQENLIQAQAKELILWSHLCHNNVLPFHGVFHSREEIPRICIVSPWMTNGDLAYFLKKFPKTPKVPLILDIITGLQYLHEYGVIHGDLKAKNILISEDKRAMIADFGISNVAMTIATTKKNASGTVKWMAPELLTQDDPRGTTQSDIWAFGCVCYEAYTGLVPFHEYLQNHHLITAFLRGSTTPFTPRKAEDKKHKDIELQKIDVRMQVIMGMCWEDIAALRPTAEMIRRAMVRLGEVDDRRLVDGLSAQSLKTHGSDAQIDHHRLFDILTRVLQQSPIDSDVNGPQPREEEG